MKSLKQIQSEVKAQSKLTLSIDCVIFGYDDKKLKLLLIKSDLQLYKNQWSLLGNLVDTDEELDAAAYRILVERTGLKDIYLEQVQTFGKLHRHPGGRVVSVAYLSLINVDQHELCKPDHELHWHDVDALGSLAFDHSEILEVCLGRLRKRIMESPLVFSLLPRKFSMRSLQNVYEVILGCRFDRRNFRKKFFAMDYLIDLGEMEKNVTHRPGKLYRFNHKKYQKSKDKEFDI
jgi:8-oxo-dGTP diphosphatase